MSKLLRENVGWKKPDSSGNREMDGSAGGTHKLDAHGKCLCASCRVHDVKLGNSVDNAGKPLDKGFAGDLWQDVAPCLIPEKAASLGLDLLRYSVKDPV